MIFARPIVSYGRRSRGYTGAMGRLLQASALLVWAGVLSAETAGGVKWSRPPQWKVQPDRPLRAATYRVPAITGDSEDGECAVYYFGPGQGGTVEANIKRWVGQFQQPDKPAQVQKELVHGLRVTTVDVAGTYTGAGGPMSPAQIAKAQYRLLGAIVEGPEGPVFFKFTGPTRTVAQNREAFTAMVRSVSR